MTLRNRVRQKCCISRTDKTSNCPKNARAKHFYFAVLHPLRYLSIFVYYEITAKLFTLPTIINLRKLCNT